MVFVEGNHPNRRPVDREDLIGELFLPVTLPQGPLPAVLVLHGSEGGEGFLYKESARALAESIPNARLRLIEGAGHLVFIERAAEVNREVLEFLAEGELYVASDRA
jgi:pimeloyl-ACP methyl ester carboxylesterase